MNCVLKNIFFQKQFVNRGRQFCSVQGGTLYTWGKNTKSLGYPLGPQIQSTSIPQKVNGFKNNIQQVVMGSNHSALITTDDQLYTWGSGSYGMLGHNDDKSYTEPKLIDFFVKNNLKVKQVALGEHFTAALTQDGDVWTWGYAGRQQNFLMDLLFQQVGGLGHGDCKIRYTPTPVEALRKLQPIKHISCGFRFVNALNVNNELYNWGKGEYGVFGDGNNKALKTPKLNDYFTYLSKEQKVEIVEIKSCNTYTFGLMSDGLLYGWGSNDNGQMGIKNEIGVEMYETANFPTQTVNDDFKNHKILAFDVGEDITAFLLDNNQVYWSGSKLAYKPERFPLPAGIGKITHIGTCFRCVVVVTEDGNVYFKQGFVQEQEQDIKTGLQTTSLKKLFGDVSLLDIGGTYRNRYALVVEQ